MLRHPCRFSFVALLLAFPASCDSPGPRESAIGQDEAAPRIHIPHHHVDVGRISLGHHDIEVEIFNHGTDELQISGLKTSCGCTRADVSETLIGPGKTGILTVSVSPRSAEIRSAKVSVYSNDTRRQKVDVTVSWVAVGPVAVKPMSVEFGPVAPHSMTAKTIRVEWEVDESGDPLCHTSRVQCRPAELLEARLKQSQLVEDQLVEEWEVVLNAAESNLVVAGQIEFLLDGCVQQSQIVPVEWALTDVIDVSPSRLFLGAKKVGDRFDGVVTLTCEGSSRLEIDSVRWSGDELGLELSHRLLSDSSREVRITGEVPTGSGLRQDELRIECRLPLERTLRVPVTALVLSD